MDCLMLWGIHSAKNGALRLSVMIICSSTSFDGTGPRKMTDAVRYLPLRGSHAAIMFLASNTCSVSSLVVTLRQAAWDFAVSGAWPTMKKCRRGNGIKFTPSLRRSELSWPAKRRQEVVPAMAVATRPFSSAKVGLGTSRVEKHTSYSASLSRTDTSGDGNTEYVAMMRSGYSSRTLEINRVPIPLPVPPPIDDTLGSPGAGRSPQTPYGWHPLPRRSAAHLRCSGPWPSCFPHRSPRA